MAMMNLAGDQKEQLQAMALSTLWRSLHLKEGGSGEERRRDWQAKVEWMQRGMFRSLGYQMINTISGTMVWKM